MAKVVVTGVREVDDALESFENKMRKKFLRTASRKVTKEVVLSEFKENVPKNKGVLASIASVRAIKRSRNRIGHEVRIDREKLFAKYEAKYGRRPTLNGKDFFYPATVEFGSRYHKKHATLRKSLYDNSAEIRRKYIKSVKSQAKLGRA